MRTIQQHDLPEIDPTRRVLGVIRPTVERLGEYSTTGHIGIFGTPGTIQSESYDMEIAKLHPGYRTIGHACPMWVPLIENGEAESDGADFFVKQETERLMEKDPAIDTVVLACTHYPIMFKKIRQYMPSHITLLKQGEIVAESLAAYLKRHPSMEQRITRNESGGSCRFLTTENSYKFSSMASLFLGEPIHADTIEL